jgi:hypothetical protein
MCTYLIVLLSVGAIKFVFLHIKYAYMVCENGNFGVKISELESWKINSPWSIVLLEKIIVAKLVKKPPVFYGIWRQIIVFTRARHWILSWARRIQSTTSHPVYLRSILITIFIILVLLQMELHVARMRTEKSTHNFDLENWSENITWET